MNIFLYVIIFIIGIMFGSFYTLAVYRIPKNIDIVKKHSYCPNCNHKLGFFELIPIFSYLILGGKCKHCKQKIRIRYLLLETLSGILFVLLALAIGIRYETIDIQKIIVYSFAVLYLTAVILIAGIDKEYIKINKKVLAYGVIISIIYMIYLYTIATTSIYRYAIYLAIYIILLAIDTLLTRKYAKESYINDLLMFLNVILIFSDIEVFLLTIILTLIALLIYALITKLVQKKNIKQKTSKIPFGFFIGATNVIALFIGFLVR